MATGVEVGQLQQKLGVDVAIFCQLADLDVEGKTFIKKKYWRNSLMCTLVLQRRF
jgi:hypothetical protein